MGVGWVGHLRLYLPCVSLSLRVFFRLPSPPYSKPPPAYNRDRGKRINRVGSAYNRVWAPATVPVKEVSRRPVASAASPPLTRVAHASHGGVEGREARPVRANNASIRNVRDARVPKRREFRSEPELAALVRVTCIPVREPVVSGFGL